MSEDRKIHGPAGGGAEAGSGQAGGCCGGPAAPDTGACCVDDATAKARGAAGCGCREKAVPCCAGRN